MSSEKVVIIIPTYNEALAIEETLIQVFQETQKISDKDIHVLIFDSNSTDNTQAIIKHLQQSNPQLHLQTEPQKSGLGSAYRQAMRYALDNMGAEIVIEFDADLSHQPQYLAPMLEKMQQYDVVLGSRYVKGGHIPDDWGWHRKLLSILGNYIARLALTPQYKDFTSGFRATRREALQQALPPKFISNQYAYKIELLWRLHQNKARIEEYPITFVDRQQGFSKLPTNSILDSLRVLAVLRLQHMNSYFKMCLVGVSGMLVQYVIYNLLRLQLSPVSAVQFAVLGAMLNNYVLNNHFTFKKETRPTRYQAIKSLALFTGYSTLMIGFQSYWLHLGIRYFGTGYLKENIILMSGIIVGSFLNYTIYSKLIWRKISSK